MIEVQGLAKYFGRFTALRDLNLTVGKGEFLALFGRNGAGKTTFLRILSGLSRPSSGTCSIRPSESRFQRYQRGAIGYLSHNTSLYADLTALENLRFFSRLMDVPADDGRLLRRIGQVGLAGRESEPVRNFSRGMQQRLAIARAFLHDPEILLLDEPFTGLDREGSEFLKEFLLNSHAKNKTCIMAIHDTRLGYEMANRLVVIDKGVAAMDVAAESLSLGEFEQRYSTISDT